MALSDPILIHYTTNPWHPKNLKSISSSTEGYSKVTASEARKMVTRLSKGEFNTLRLERGTA